MKTQKSSSIALAKNLIPIGLMVTIQQSSGAQAAQVDTQAHIQEMTSLVQQALTQATSEAGVKTDLAALSSAEINSQIHTTLQQAIKEQEKEKSKTEANSKLGFLQKVVTLECFFGGSDCLFRDKQAMMQGKVTEFAKKKFEEGNTHVDQYLSQMNVQVAADLKQKNAEKSMDNNQKVSY